MPAPNRHHHIIWDIYAKTGQRVDGQQGFLDEQGMFYDRKAALQHALKNGQVKDPLAVRAAILFSEDIW